MSSSNLGGSGNLGGSVATWWTRLRRGGGRVKSGFWGFCWCHYLLHGTAIP